MPSVSKKQHNLMAAVAHSPSFAKKVGIPQSVGKDFSTADKGRKFSKGGTMANTSRMNRLEELGRVDAEKARTPKGKANLAAEKKRIVGEMKFAKGGAIKASPMGKVTAGGTKKFGEHSVQTKGHTRGKNLGDAGKKVGITAGARRGK